MRPRYRLLVVILIALVGAAVFAYYKAALTVVVATPSRGPAVAAVYATGTVEPVRWAKVGPKSTGRIVEILAHEGDRVARNALLARLNDDEASAKVDQLAAQERLLRNEVKRLTPLLPKGYVGKQAYDRAVSERRQAEAALDAARHVLDDLRMVSPMDGVVLRQDGEVGETVTSSQTLFWVGEPTPLRVTAEVDEEDIPRVRLGQRVLIKADAFPDQVLEGLVNEITPKGDPINKSYRVRVGLPTGTPLRIGMTAEINVIVREQSNALLAPAGALVDGALWVARDGKAHRVAVKTGVADENKVEILEGLSGDEQVILSPPQDLKEGRTLRIKKPSGS